MKLLLVDGYSLLYRAYFSSPPLTTREGKPTGAIYGFSRMLVNLLDEYKPEYALVALDAHGPTFRHEADVNYKANRPDMPDDLRIQTGLAREMLTGLSIAHYEHVGFEADDIIGTLSHIGAEKGLEVIIVTGDGDSLQLVNEHVSALLTRRGVSDLSCYTPEKVQEKFGFGPLLVPDFKGLRGDTSDNIPGVPGIGDKTGMSLIGKFGSLENIYERIEEVTPPRIQGLLVTHREVAFQSRDLARIVTDLPIEFDFENSRYTAPADLTSEQRETALATVKLYEFKSMIPRYSARPAGAAGESGAPAVAESVGDDELELQASATLRTADAAEARQWLETNAKADIAVLLDGDRGIMLAAAGNALHYTGALTELKPWLEDAAHRKIVHDAKTLKLNLCKYGIALDGVTIDALLVAYLLDPTRQHHPIENLAKKYLSRRLLNDEAAAATGRKKTASLFSEEEAADDGPRIEALGCSACALHAVAPVLLTALQSIGEAELYDELELPLVDVLVRMEQCGMLLDVPHLKKLSRHLEAEALRLQGEIWELAGEEFNIGSPKQLQVVLFEKMGLAKGRSTKTGYSTDVHTLEKLAEENEVVKKILEYRGITKLKSTYVEALLKGMDVQAGRVHTNLNQTGTVSGRVSSSDPNLQNVPIRTEQGRQIRKAFIAPPGHVILSADYSQIELRILAHITGDAPLVEAFQADQDVHARTAADLFEVAVEDVDSDMRRKAKMVNYAIAYGVSGFGLAKQLGTGSPAEAAEIIKKYFEALPGVKKYIDDISKSAKADGYVQTLMGRRRPLPEINSPRQVERAAAERTAINHPIQGTAADIMKIAMLAIDRDLRAGNFKARMTMQVHDELIFEVPEDEVDRLAALVHDRMRNTPTERLQLRVPLEVEVETGPNWDDTESVEGL